MSDTYTGTESYTVSDVGVVVRRLAADFLMIAESSGCWTEDEAQRYAADVEVLAKAGFLAMVDVTLLTSLGTEARAVRYEVDDAAGSLVNQRPGGVRWPRLAGATLRITLVVTPQFTADAERQISPKLHHTWHSTMFDPSHDGLEAADGRNYASGGYALRRKDYGA